MPCSNPIWIIRRVDLFHDLDGTRFVATRIRSIAMSTGLLIGRLVFGLLLAVHGAQKLFGWFGGYGLSGTGTAFEGLGFRPGRLFAAAAGVAEFGGGLLLRSDCSSRWRARRSSRS